MKYIDAEKLIAEIERQLEKYDPHYTSAGSELKKLLSFINSLQQEQTKKKKNCNGCPHCVDRKDQYGWHFKGCFGGPYKGKFIAEIDECPLQQKVEDNLVEEEPVKEEICSKCVYYGKDDGYCYYPHGGMQRRINENGVYECTAFWEREQEQPEVDLEKEIMKWQGYEAFPEGTDITPLPKAMDIVERTARYFYELGKKGEK